MSIASKLRRVFKPRSARGWLLLSIFGVLAALSALVARAVHDVGRQAEDSQCQSRLFYLGFALRLYQDCYTSLPPPFISDDLGKPLYSWRVLMLPFCEGHGLYDEFDFTKPWNDPDNIGKSQGRFERQLKSLFSCPLSRHTDAMQTDYFYALNVQDRWPRDFFHDSKTPPYVLLLESQAHSVHWSEPVDVVYLEPGLNGLLAKINESKATHRRGFHCYASDGAVVTIAPGSTPEHLLQNLKTSARMPRAQKAPGKGEMAKFVAKLMDILSDRERYGAFYTRHTALLLLGELGPQAKAATAMIRQVVAEEQDERLTRVAAFALAKIER